MSLDAVRAAIVATLEGLNIGPVHGWERYASTNAALLALYSTDGVLGGWYVRRVRTSESSPSLGRHVERIEWEIRGFLGLQDAAATELGIRVTWRGKGVEEKGYDAEGKMIVAVDPRYFRPAEVDTLLGDPAKAKAKLGWQPKVSFRELVAEMVREDLKAAERDELVKKHGYSAYDYNE